MKKVLLSVFVAAMGWGNALAQQTADQDTLLRLMNEELSYSMQELKKQPDVPYFMSMRTVDTKSYSITSSFGTISGSSVSHSRNLAPQIRLGSKELDNFKYTTQCAVGQQGHSVLPGVKMPLNCNFDTAIKDAIWHEVMARYNAACNLYSQSVTQAQTKTENEDKAPCFSDAQAEKYYEPALAAEKTNIDVEAWKKRLNEISAVFKAYPELLSGSASLTFEVVRTWIVNTDGTEVAQNRTAARLMLSAQVKADDGMDLPVHEDFFAYNPMDLPDNSTVIAAAKQLAEQAKKLRVAPVADPYTGPCIMSGPASGVFFHEIFGHRLEGHRLKTGGQTFKKMVGEKLLPATFQVYCDPTLKQIEGKDLNGYYLYDDEGVKAHRVDNVVDGVLKEFLMSRVPLDGFPKSNAHGRTSGGGDPVSRQSNLVVETTDPRTDIQLRQMLIAEAAKQGKEYGYFFKSVTSGYTLTGEGGSLNSFNVTPTEVYRVYVDGRPDELVRGVDMIGTPLSIFSNIVAGGNKLSTFTGVCGAESGWVPVTASSPSIFVSKIETQRREQSRDLPAILPAPAVTNRQFDKYDDMVFAALQDEMKRGMDSLKLADQPAPFYMTYNLARFRQFQASASLGGVSAVNVMPWRCTGSLNVALGNYAYSSDVQPDQLVPVEVGSGADYDNIRRNFWGRTDLMYKYSLQLLAGKNQQLRAYPLPDEYKSINNMQQLPPTTNIQHRDHDTKLTKAEMEKYVSEVSLVFADYKDLFDTRFSINGFDEDIYHVTSEDIQTKQPGGMLEVTAKASVRLANGTTLSDVWQMFGRSFDELPTVDEAKAKVKTFADNLMKLKAAPSVTEYYQGPVMYEGETVGLAFAQSTNQYLIARPNFIAPSNQVAMQMNSKVFDANITIKHLSGMPEYDGVKLIGNYVIDGESVELKPEYVLVEKGIFKRQLNGRYPAFKSPVSTGNTFFASNPGMGVVTSTAPGIIKVEAAKTMSLEKMKKDLMKRGKEADLQYVYIVRQNFSMASKMVYRVDVKTGEETLVQYAKISDPDAGKLKTIAAVSSENVVTNYQFGTVNSSIIYPKAIIINDVEIKPETPKTEKAQAILPPLMR